jgi:hypothetical protein
MIASALIVKMMTNLIPAATAFAPKTKITVSVRKIASPSVAMASAMAGNTNLIAREIVDLRLFAAILSVSILVVKMTTTASPTADAGTVPAIQIVVKPN